MRSAFSVLCSSLAVILVVIFGFFISFSFGFLSLYFSYCRANLNRRFAYIMPSDSESRLRKKSDRFRHGSRWQTFEPECYKFEWAETNTINKQNENKNEFNMHINIPIYEQKEFHELKSQYHKQFHIQWMTNTHRNTFIQLIKSYHILLKWPGNFHFEIIISFSSRIVYFQVRLPRRNGDKWKGLWTDC